MWRASMQRMLAVALLVLLGATASAAEPGTKALRDDDVVARVNGTVIYRKSVRDVVQGIIAMQDSQPSPQTIDQLAADALDSLIALELLYAESQARGVVVSDAAVNEEIARSKSGFPNAQAFEAAMKVKGMTEPDLRRDTRKTMAVNRLLEGTVWKDLSITPEQIKDFYEQNREEFKHPAEWRISHILIRVPQGASPGERDAAKERAGALAAQIKGGADFAELARRQSQDPGSAALGGDLGFVAKGDMDEAFEKQAFALTPGQVSGVVSTPYGFDIIKVTDRRDAGYAPLSEVQDRIREVLLKSERQQRQADFVAELRKKAKIELPGKDRKD
jgi:peptidyl-prolyl cis-trans isomerase C